MEMIILIVMMVAVFWVMNRSARKAQQKQADQRAEAVTLGNNVVTQAGFFGRIVDIDGDAVTLESPSGDESVWLRSSIVAAMDIPLGEDSSYDDNAADSSGEVVDMSEEADGSEPDAATDEGRITNSSPFVDEDGNPTDNK